jgi:hypothetical protein
MEENVFNNNWSYIKKPTRKNRQYLYKMRCKWENQVKKKMCTATAGERASSVNTSNLLYRVV